MGPAGFLLTTLRRCKVKSKHLTKKKVISITRLIFITSQVFALLWVTISYIIALYATIKLKQVFPVVELSQQAINTIIGVGIMKTTENIFEHNEGIIFGNSHMKGGEGSGYFGEQEPREPGDHCE